MKYKPRFTVALAFWSALALTSPLLYAQPDRDRWVDSVFQTLKEDEKIAQLMFVPASPGKGDRDRIMDWVKSHHVGGIIVKGGEVQGLVDMLNGLQEMANVPLLVGMDADRGIGNTLTGMGAFPEPIVLGAVRDDSLVFAMGKEVGRQMKRVGIHLTFGPSLDMGLNAGTLSSSYGSDYRRSSQKMVAFLKGLQQENILAFAKNFPVQGITVLKMEKKLPVLSPYADSAAVYPFKRLMENKITGVMPATADFPLFYEKKKSVRKNTFTPSALSSLFIGDWLKRHLQFDGLVMANIPGTVDVTGKHRAGEAELFAFQSGNDILLFPENIPAAVKKIRALVLKDTTYATQLDKQVKKVLGAKYDAGLARYAPVMDGNLARQMDTPESRLLFQRLMSSAVTVARDENHSVPVMNVDTKTFASVSLGSDTANVFNHYLGKYVNVRSFRLTSPKDTASLARKLKAFSTVVVSVFPGATDKLSELWPFIQSQQRKREVMVVGFVLPTDLRPWSGAQTLVEAYTDHVEMQKMVPQVIFGARPARGFLPVGLGQGLSAGQGIGTDTTDRLLYSLPEDAGLDGQTLNKIAVVAEEAIRIGATPGCHVLVARDGKVVYEQSFGHTTYDNKVPVTDNTLYDLASVTKVSATLQAVMFMHDRGLIDLYKKASAYLPELKNSNKKDFTLKDILTHQAGLWPFLPFWAQTMKDSTFMPEFYSHEPSEAYPFPVAENLYAASVMKDSLWSWIIKAKIREKPDRTPYDYRYSDMGFYILQHLAEKILNQNMEDFLEQNLYGPLGAYSTGYLPLRHFPAHRIAPTENDRLFRKSLLVGMVHDQGAAMHGGIAGHAGLFSTANDLAKLGQMLLQEGQYGGIRYYKPETVRLFTHKQYATSARGLGWHKPTLNQWNSPTSYYASASTFGHTGFTGTCIWVDPVFNLVYVFLSNRVHPDMNNNKLLNANIRSRIQDVIYESMFRHSQYGTEAIRKNINTDGQPDRPLETKF